MYNNYGDNMELLYLCLKIFFVRILDVSLGTVRTIMTVRGKNLIATIIGFIEVTIWFLVVKDALNSDSNSLFIVFSYAGGYAVGTYIGGILSGFIKSKLCIQIIINQQDINLIDELRNNGYAVSVMDVKGYDTESKYMLLMEIDSDKFKKLEKIVHNCNEKIFMMVNETKYVKNGYFGGIVK